MKKLGVFVIFCFLLASPCFGITLLLKEEAFYQNCPDPERMEERKVIASEEKIASIKKQLGGKLTHILNKEAQEINQKKEFTFYYCCKDKEEMDISLILDEPGKWGLIKFLICLNPGGEVKKVNVLEYQEARGRPIAAQSFLRQFEGKNINSPLKIGKDIQGITGATVSSEAVCFAVKKAVVLYKELALK